ncbi:hypothetical protein MRX96_000548 [Rhipicephalus microplus]
MKLDAVKHSQDHGVSWETGSVGGPEVSAPSAFPFRRLDVKPGMNGKCLANAGRNTLPKPGDEKPRQHQTKYLVNARRREALPKPDKILGERQATSSPDNTRRNTWRTPGDEQPGQRQTKYLVNASQRAARPTPDNIPGQRQVTSSPAHAKRNTWPKPGDEQPS